MLYTADGRKIRANKRVTYTVAGVSPDGSLVELDERHADGTVKGGPTVTAEEWHRYTGGAWVRCGGSGRRPVSVNANPHGFYYSGGVCGECGNGVALTTAGVAFKHDRPAGLVRRGGVWVQVKS